ncbi:rho GTPase-activating 30 isoform X1 [Pelobates cultripes]|uniref:Rho GTPase-activating 30 isoform X1 n=1 Tax=Pelobates cultripes TaxID=61616 RepID=A0AAD1TM57_PELCU|nr:rho GTPase-activating 30 isoform X1 [Pelobates cultripes]
MSLAMKARQKGKKKSGKDKVFGCDLVEHLQLSGQEVPQVLKCCTEFVEEHGVVDGIYRLCGIASNVQKLRQEFETDRLPDMNKDTYYQDVHCVSSLCKAYFRQLPNPLLTYQLYDKFADAVAIQLEQERLVKIKDVLKDLPLPHYRTLEYLMRHLVRMASFSSQTNMHARNLAIVWAPNLLRSKDIEASGFNGTAAFMEVRIQSIVVEFILTHVEQLFGDTPLGNGNETNASTPEDYFRSLSYNIPSVLNQGDGPPQIRPYHTIIDIADQKRKGSIKTRKWRSIFNLGRSNNDSKRKTNKQDDKEITEKMNLRPAKSMDSLSSAPYTTDVLDLGHSRLVRTRSPKILIPIRRESFESQSKQGNSCPVRDSEDQDTQLDVMQPPSLEFDEEPLAKSEPTTPKPARHSTTAHPQGRSPKSTHNRAEKCVGVHISGPFSVTLPFHITSNLSRLTRGMECPSLIYNPLKISDKSFAQEESHSETSLGISSPVPENEKDEPFYLQTDTKENVSLEREEPKDTMALKVELNLPATEEQNAKEQNSLKVENDEISFDVQETFSFLDSQDINPEFNVSDAFTSDQDVCPDEKMSGYTASYNHGDSDILEDELGSVYMSDCVQVEEFSVEPPPDELSTDDEDQMYFIPTGCYDIEDQSREIEDSEDIFHSAYDILSPLCQELGTPFTFLNVEETDMFKDATELEKINSLQQNEESLQTEPRLEPTVGQEKEKSSNLKDSLTPNIAYDEESMEVSDSETCGQLLTLENECSLEITEEIIADSKSKNELEIQPEEDDENVSCPSMLELENSLLSDKDSEVFHVETNDPALPNELSSLEIQTVLHENQAENQDDTQFHLSLEADGSILDNMIKCNGLDEIQESTMQIPDNILLTECETFAQQDKIIECEALKDNQKCPLQKYTMSTYPVSKAEQHCKLVNGMHPDGGASMKIASTLPKIQQVKSVPVVPPKPQFAKLPPALRSKIHVGSASSTNKDTKHQITETMNSSETAELNNDSLKKQRYSGWKSGVSISFDTAVALAKERQMSQCPVRRMQTYCIGDTYEIDSTKVDNSLGLQNPCLKLGSSRINRPLSCLGSLSCTEEANKECSHLKDMPTSPVGTYGSHSVLGQESWPKAQNHSARNRMSLPRIGKQSSIEEPPDSCQNQRRSLL